MAVLHLPNYRFKHLAVALLFFCKLQALGAWGFEPHRRINQQACLILPPPLFGFYKPHIAFMMQHATDPDMRRYVDSLEAGRHFIDLEHFGGNMDSLPMNYYQAENKYGRLHLIKEGNLPWNIIRNVYLLKNAFSEQNTDKILKISADLGHYVADAHVPLHTTENYNGQLSGQKGIHSLWETLIPNLFIDTLLIPMPEFEYRKNWTSDIWNCIGESHRYVETVLQSELHVRNEITESNWYEFQQSKDGVKKTYSSEYLRLYHKKLNGMVENRFIASAQLFAQLMYTAWVLAGEPELEELNNPVTQQNNSQKGTISYPTEVDCNHQ